MVVDFAMLWNEHVIRKIIRIQNASLKTVNRSLCSAAWYRSIQCTRTGQILSPYVANQQLAKGSRSKPNAFPGVLLPNYTETAFVSTAP